MRLLVTGSEGSLMQWLIPLLMRQGHDIAGVDNFARHGAILRSRDYAFTRGDLTDPSVADAAVQGVDGVLQAAALIYGVGGFHRYPADILSKDITLNQNILQAMLRHDVEHMAFVSSSMVYERCRSHPSREEDVRDAPAPATDYGLSKLTNERLVQAFAAQYGIQYSIWRPFNIMTPLEKSEDRIGTSHVFADFMRHLVLEKKNPLPIIGDGEQIRCFTWIGDVASGIAEHAFNNPAAHNEIFNLGNPEPMSMKALAREIFQRARTLSLLEDDGQPLAFETVEAFRDDVVKRIPDVDKARRLLNWQPTLSVRESVQRCVEAIAPAQAP